MTGQTYRLTARIAAGELAETFQAVRGESEPVVIKLFQSGTTDPRYAREIAATATQLKALPLPGILHVLEVGLTSGRLAVVREHIEGFNLGQILSRLTAWGIMLPTPLALLIVLELLDTLQAVHELGVTHGSITPGNILLSSRGQPALCDFGALRALWSVPHLAARFSATGRGSYRARELERGEQATPQADLFSLGAVAYQLLTLREVSPDKSGSTAPRSPFPVSSQVDQRLYPLLMRAMDTIPQLRYVSCLEFAEALRGFLAENNISASREDLQKFLRDLFPEGGKLTAGGPLPFSEPFTLTSPPEPEESTSASPLESIGAAPPAPLGQAGETNATAEPVKAFAAGADAAADRPDLSPRTPSQLRAARPHGFAAAASEEPRPAGRARKVVGLAIASAVAVAFALTVMFWRSGGESKPPADPKSASAPTAAASAPTAAASAPSIVQPGSTAVAAKAEQPPPSAAEEPPASHQPTKPEPTIEWDTPPRKGAGFLSISSDVPVIVYIDGRRVKKHAPLKRYPVAPGVHKITIATLDGREKREVAVRVGKGQLRKIDEVFRRSAAIR
ncbi:MAG TPA: protein kinase [Myxococcaceae bacterium]|nr:protein kinase [Myxococcaceae bacterium]